MQERNEELKDIKDKVLEVVENIDDPELLKLILEIFESRKTTEKKDGRAFCPAFCVYSVRSQ